MAHAPPPLLDNRSRLDRSNLTPLAMPDEVDLSPKTIGQKLRDERDRRGIQLNDVALALQIRSSCLIAIEEGRLDDLPGRAFTIGYVGRYARYLGLDVEMFVRPLADFNHRVEIVPLREQKLPPVVVFLCGFLLAVLMYSGDDIVAFATHERAAEASPAQDGVTALTVAPVERAAPVAPAEPSAPVESPAPLAAGVAVTPVVSLPPALASAAREQLPAGQRLGLRNRNSRITLRVHRPTTVVVRGTRNRVFIDRMLARGDTYRVPNRPGLRLTVGDAGAVEIMLDGASIGFVGEPGVATRGLPLNPRTVVDRQKRA